MSPLEGFSANDVNVNASGLTPPGKHILVPQPHGGGTYHHRLAGHPARIDAAFEQIDGTDYWDRRRLNAVVDAEVLLRGSTDSRDDRRQRRNHLISATDGMRNGPYFVGVVVAKGDCRQLGIAAEHGQRPDVLQLAVAGASPLEIAEANVRIFSDRGGKFGVFLGIRLLREHEIMDLPLRLCCANGIDQLGIAASRPGPATDFAYRFLVDSHQDDVAAGGALVDMIANDAQAVFRILAGTGDAEQEAKHQRPAENPFRTLGLPCTVLSAQPSHGKGGSFCLITSLRRKGLTNRKPNRINGPAAYFGAVRR